MLIQCPSCRTTYRVADHIVTPPNATFRCSRCKHVFVLGETKTPTPPDTEMPEITKPQRESEENKELSFAFPSAERKERSEKFEKSNFEFPKPKAPDVERPMQRSTEPPKSEIQEPSFVVDEKFHALAPQEPPSPAPDDSHTTLTLREKQEDSWSINPPPPGEQSFAIPTKERSDGLQTTPLREAPLEFEKNSEGPLSSVIDEEPAPTPDLPEEQPLSTRPYLSLFCCLALFYSILTFVTQARPNIAATILKPIPLLGAYLYRTDHLQQGIDLQSLGSSFQPVPGSRDVLVVTGIAVNRNPVSVRGVKVEANIYNAEGKEVERQTIWVGNAISLKILRGIPAQEIADIQKLEPLKRFEVAAGQQVNFAIVFFKPTGNVKSFGCRVLSAEEAA